MKKKDAEPISAPFHSPFVALKKLRDDLPSVPLASPEKPAIKGPARAVVRMERKGHGGKEVTVVEKLDLPTVQLETWSKELKQALGCGGFVEEDALVIQGDHRERVRSWLTQRGVKKISMG